MPGRPTGLPGSLAAYYGVVYLARRYYLGTLLLHLVRHGEMCLPHRYDQPSAITSRGSKRSRPSQQDDAWPASSASLSMLTTALLRHQQRGEQSKRCRRNRRPAESQRNPADATAATKGEWCESHLPRVGEISTGQRADGEDRALHLHAGAQLTISNSRICHSSAAGLKRAANRISNNPEQVVELLVILLRP